MDTAKNAKNRASSATKKSHMHNQRQREKYYQQIRMCPSFPR